MRRLVPGLLLFLIPWAAHAQTADNIRWVPNGPVWAIARHEGITYVGGQFTMVSPPSGGGAPINSANDVIPAGFPQVAGSVYAVAPDGAGGWYIGGQFTHVGGQPRNNLAQVASDYSVTAWNPNANGTVFALATTPSGNVFAGGDFTQIGSFPRQRLAEINSAGSPAGAVIIVNSTVRALAASGSVMYVGGDFTTANGAARNHLFAVDLTTHILVAWNPNANGSVFALEVAVRNPGPTTTILVGGSFNTLAGQPRANLGELTTAAATTGWNPGTNGTVRDLQENVVDYVGGDFTTIGGQPRNRLAAVQTDGTVTAWNPNVDGPVRSLCWFNNFVYVGGTFENAGGAARKDLAKIDEASGLADTWDPRPNNFVNAIAPGFGKVYVGGVFTGFKGVVRHNLAAFDDWTGEPTTWDPDADGVVRAIGLRSFGPDLYTVYVGGDFQLVHGDVRSHMAAIHPKTGVPTPWITNTNLTVRSISVNDTMVVFGGDYSVTDGENTAFVAGKRHSGGPVIHFDGMPIEANVYTVALGSNTLHVGGSFGLARFDLTTHALTGYGTPSMNGSVNALLVKGTTVYAGGDFTLVGGVPHNRLARLSNNSTLDGWACDADSTVRALAQGELGLLVGGDFSNLAVAPHLRVGQVDQSTAAGLPWNADVVGGSVYALAARGPVVDIAGTFRGLPAAAQAEYAVVGLNRNPMCGAALPSAAGGRPKALAVLDVNADGIDDIAVCEDGGATDYVHVLRGNGFGSFALVQSLPFATTPMTVVAQDFDKDGRPDLAVCESDSVGVLRIFHNVSGTFQPWTSVTLLGRGDGFAAGDFDADGIVDLAACLTDSASTIKRGGLEFFKGGGTNGTWDGTFTFADKSMRFGAASARRVIAHDFDQDGFTDFLFTGMATAPLLVFTGGTLQASCENFVADFISPADGFAIANGDFNEDGRSDLVYSQFKRLVVRFNNGTVGCGNWFNSLSQMFVNLPSTPRDLAVMDVDRDGILDVLCTFDSLSTLAYCRGGGSNGVPDGTIQPPVNLASHDVWAIATGDFVSDGITDVLTSMATCGYVSVLQGTDLPQFPMTITLDSPNGGESLARTPPPPSPSESSEIALSDEFALATAPPPETNVSTPAAIASQRTISWTKGAGIHGVDVELSRNDGATWETIATNMPGSSMAWYSTPPAASLARVRVRDAAYRGHLDVSDAPFSVIAGLVGTPPPGAPQTAGLALLGRNPALGAMRFRLDVPQVADVAVIVYDAAGRRVRTLARRSYAPGTYDLGWDGADERGADARPGVYFVKTTIGSFRTTRKVVML